MKKLFLLAAAFVAGIAVMAQKPDEVVKLSADTYNFGKIKQGVPVTTYFTVTNISDKPVVLENVVASCGCTTPEWSKEPIAPNGTTKIKVGYNAAAPMPFTKDVTIRLAGIQESKIIHISGEVLTADAFDAYTKTDEYKKAEAAKAKELRLPFLSFIPLALLRGFLFFSKSKLANMKEQLQEAWRTNNKICLLFIELIDDEAMDKSLSPKNGRTVYQQLVHIHNVRCQWLDIVAKGISANYQSVGKENPYSKEMLLQAFEDSGRGIEESIDKSWEKNGKVSSFKKGLIPFIGYLISHEAHHRGNILLTLKQCGVKIPDELKWGIWEWNKI
jgi:uncharacterized damage-inducible protein DinB